MVQEPSFPSAFLHSLSESDPENWVGFQAGPDASWSGPESGDLPDHACFYEAVFNPIGRANNSTLLIKAL